MTLFRRKSRRRQHGGNEFQTPVGRIKQRVFCRVWCVAPYFQFQRVAVRRHPCAQRMNEQRKKISLSSYGKLPYFFRSCTSHSCAITWPTKRNQNKEKELEKHKTCSCSGVRVFSCTGCVTIATTDPCSLSCEKCAIIG